MSTAKSSAKGQYSSDSTRVAGWVERTLNRTSPGSRRDGSDWQQYRILGDLDRFMRRVLDSFLKPFWVYPDPSIPHSGILSGPHEVSDLVPTPWRKVAARNLLGLDDIASLADDFPRLGSYYRCRSDFLRYAPHLALFFETYPQHPVSKLNVILPDGRYGDGCIQAEVFNDFVAVLRAAAKARKLAGAMHAWGLNGVDRLQGLYQYLDGLFKQRESLSVFHLNFSHTLSTMDLRKTDWPAQNMFLRDLAKARSKFLDSKSHHPALFEYMAGYVWSVETSLAAGFSLHLTLFFDTVGLKATGNLNGRLDIPLAFLHLPEAQRPKVTFPELVGDYLVETTGGTGRYQLSHRDRLTYGDPWVWGEIKAGAQRQRDMLKEALGFLASTHQLARLKSIPSAGKGGAARPKFFGMGRLVRRRPNAPKRDKEK